jgi:hypothetical protein
MNRFFTALTKTLIAAPSLFQIALPLPVANLGPPRASRMHGTIVKTIRRGPQAAAIAIRPAKILMVGISLGALLTMSNSVQVANAQKANTAREQALRECNPMERSDTHDPYEGQDRQQAVRFTKPAWPITARRNDSD